jgi:hypothetical protein
MTENEKLLELLKEAQAALQGVAEYDTDPDKSWTLTKAACREAQESIDAALAESRLSDGPLSKQLRPDVECAPWVIGAVKKLEGERDEARAALDDVYRRGAEAMREQAASLFDGGNNVPGLMRSHEFRDFIRSLPIPEDK